MKKILIIGGGAAGMFAAAAAAEKKAEVHLFEKNERLGKKLYITGKGRCNLTNACDEDEFLLHVCTNRKFLYSAFYGCTNQDVIRFFEANGCPTKVERGQRVFPVSDRSADVLDALKRAMDRAVVHIHLNSEVKELLVSEPQESGETMDGAARKESPAKETKTACEDSKTAPRPADAKKRVWGVRLADGRTVSGDAVIVATGGLSYPSTGSTGDGYRFAGACGHTVTALYPSLVPFQIKEEVAKELQGLSLKNVKMSVWDGKKCLFEDFGEMMFTHFGVTGPLVLTASAAVQQRLQERPLRLVIDLKPALTEEQLDARVRREFEAGLNKQFKNVIGSLFPAKLTPVMMRLSGISPEKKVNAVTRPEREYFVRLTKHLELTVTGLRGYNEAVVTRGGVAVKEIDPATMGSKLVSGLYFAGEVLDLDGVTGGFNLQIAWSTGHAAAIGACGEGQ